MAAAVTVSKITQVQNTIRLVGTITPSGSYATTGDTLNFATATYPIGQGPIAVSSAPVVEIFSNKPTTSAQTAEFQYGFAPGTDSSNGKMQVFTGAAAQSALAELNSGAYPAGVLADVIAFEAVFSR